jgi:hypothetical protein
MDGVVFLQTQLTRRKMRAKWNQCYGPSKLLVASYERRTIMSELLPHVGLHGKAELIYENGTPYGIRDNHAYILFFRNVSKFPAQEERYKRELAEQRATADFIVDALNFRAGSSESTTEDNHE